VTTYRSTIAGSLPKPSWLAESEKLWPRFLLEGTALAEGKRDATALAVLEQARCGIGCVTDGETARTHFVHGFLEHLGGIDRENKVRRGIRADRYEADCPQIVGPVTRPVAVHVDEVRAARAAADGPLKFTLPGPMTIVDTLYDAYYRDRKTAAFAFADLLNAEMRDLIAAGVDVVQLDEPAFNVYFDEVEAWGVAALDRAFAGITARKAVHVCYGYGIAANVRWKAELGPEWDQYAHILPLLSRSSVDEISIELAGSHVPPHVLAHIVGKDVAVGAIDVASDDVETPEQVRATLERAAQYVPRERIIASTNCGMAPMKREIAWAKLAALGAGAALFAGAGNGKGGAERRLAYGANDPEPATV
jgi:5-methyltetrahydropteroyltriglutamate--homocysteine methyltransferase